MVVELSVLRTLILITPAATVSLCSVISPSMVVIPLTRISVPLALPKSIADDGGKGEFPSVAGCGTVASHADKNSADNSIIENLFT
jgi:hypothetical protein